MKVTVNGTGHELGDGATVAEVVAAVTGPGQDPAGAPERVRGVAVAVNGAVLPRAEWTRAVLCAGDRVEVLTAAQGG